MLTKNQLHKLTPAELLLLHKHIKLGKEHLQKALSEEEITAIFELATIPEEAERNLSTTKAEVLGQESLVVNTIITATLGAWMGLSTFLTLRVDSPPLFFGILSFALLVGSFVGYQSGLLKKRSSGRALDKRKLQDLEMAILKETNHHRKEEIKEKTRELHLVLEELGISSKIGIIDKDTNMHEICLAWVNDLYQNIQDNPNKYPQRSSFIAHLEEIKEDLQKTLKEEAVKDQETTKFNQIMAKLTHASFNPQEVTLQPWIQTNLNSLIVGLTPTLFGGFSSLFVYLGGAPTLAKEMGHEPLFHFLTQPNTKMIEMIIAISVTIYFAFSFLYLNRKAYKRDQEIAKIDIYLTQEENTMNGLDDKLLKLKETLTLMQKIQQFFHFSQITRNEHVINKP